MTKRRYTLAVLSALALVSAPAVMSGQVRDRTYGGYRPTPGVSRLSGTYELDARRSDNPQFVVDRATRGLPPGRRDRVAQNWINRLDAPANLSLEVVGRSVTMVSSNAPRVAFEADGRPHTEPGLYGPPVTTRADLRGDRLTVSTTGNRGADFTATFEPVPGGLRVTRRLDSDYQQTSVTVQSFYRPVTDARWNVYPGSRRMLVADGVRLVAELDRPLNARIVRDGERFHMTVVGSGPYDGAVIEGVVGRMGGPNGRVNMVFDFDHIALYNGPSGPFEGEIESIETPDRAPVRVDRSGIVHDRGGQSNAVQNGAVGATIGAIIGAIAGGKKGAVVGAVAGGVVGSAGMVVIDGRSDLVLPAGTQIYLIARNPY
jgi:hypothetical protein